MIGSHSNKRFRRAFAPTHVILFVVALGGGLVLGEMLREPRESADRATTDSQTNSLPPSATAKASPAQPAAAGATTPSPEELSQQIVALKQRLAGLERDSTPAANDSARASSAQSRQRANRLPIPTASSAARQRQRTSSGRRSLAYWHALNSIMLKEEQMRKLPVGGLTSANAAQFLQGRGEAGDYAAEAIRQLPIEGVDREVVALARDIADWYEKGTRLNDMGSFLLNEADANARRGAPGAQWSNAEKAHTRSVGELNRRGDQLRERMIQKYRLDFPDLR